METTDNMLNLAVGKSGFPTGVPAVSDAPNPVAAALTDEELREAAESLGMRTFKPARARLLKKIGIHHSVQGVVHLGLGQLAYVDDALTDLMDRAVELSKTTDLEIAVSAIQAGKAVADSMRESVKFQVELQQQKLLDAPKPQRAMVTFEQPVVLQVNMPAAEKPALTVDTAKP